MPHDTICGPLPGPARAVQCLAGIVLFQISASFHQFAAGIGSLGTSLLGNAPCS